MLTYETALRRFWAMHRTLAHVNGEWFFAMHRTVGAYRWRMFFCDASHVGAYRWRMVFLMHRTLSHTDGWWFYQWGMAIRWRRQPPKDGCIIIAPGWLAYLGSVAEEESTAEERLYKSREIF